MFESTNLAYVPRNLNIDSLFIVGVYTDECISTTVRVAADIGYFVTLIADACWPTLEYHEPLGVQSRKSASRCR